jgi:selenocysteine lyase/cysteine desulfurase
MANRLNLTTKYWSPTPLSDSPFSLGLQLSTLSPLLSEKTRLVAFTATSNILGHSTDVVGAIAMVKAKTGGKAMTVVDCVAAAVHTRIDMVKWGCDAVIFSYYKVSTLCYETDI